MENDFNNKSTSIPHYLYISIARLIILSILSCGLYEFYWMYKNWKYIGEKQGKDLPAFRRAFFGWFYLRSLLKTIRSDRDLNDVESANFSPTGLATGWIIFILIAAVLSHSGMLIALVIARLMPSYLFLVPAQSYINRINQTNALATKHSLLSKGHILCYILGLIAWVSLL
jgi:hypothetical protein